MNKKTSPMKPLIVRLLALVAMVFTLLLGSAQAATLTVNNTNDSNAGSLRGAIASAASGDTIVFDTAGVFATPQIITLTSGELLINKSLTIQGPGANQLTVSGNNASRVFNVSSGVTVRLDSLTIANGRVSGGDVTVNMGGGINNSGTLTIINSSLSGNSVSGGFSSNNYGGGILNNGGTVTITGSTLSGNSASGGNISDNRGGGIYSPFGTVTITNSTLSGNSASGGGGSTGGASGGGINASGGTTLTITNSTLSGNSATIGAFTIGGGIYHTAAVPGKIRNTIIAGNSAATNAPDVWGTYTSLGHNVIGNTSGATISAQTGDKFNADAAPLNLGSLANNGGPTQTMALMSGSVAIDAGDDCVLTNSCSPLLGSAITTDQRGTGFPRSSGGSVDIGAYEFACASVVTTTADSGPGSLRQTIADACPNGTITFDTAGVFATPQTITLTSGHLIIDKNLTIDGPGLSQLTVSGNNASTVFYVQSGTVLIEGLTVTGGNGGAGGGLYNQGTLTLANCVISNSSAVAFGGGIYNNGGNLTLNSCSVFGNNAALSDGGGIHNNGTLTLNSSTVSGNSAPVGGGIYNVDNGTATLTNCTISGNSGVSAGGIYNNLNSTVTLTNCTITGNSDTNFSGGIIANGTETLNNTIVAGNFSGQDIPKNNADIGQGTIEIANNNLIGDASTSGGILNGVNGNKVGFAVTAVLNTTLANNGGPTKTHALVCGSPALDAGSNALSGALTTDQRGSGFVRTVDLLTPNSAAGTGIDIGAFELQDSDHNGVGDGCDVTSPVITPTVTGTLGNNGWYTSDVQVSWTVTDPESSISTQTGCGPQTVSSDTNGVTFTCEATSLGGTNSQSVTVKRDATAPTLNPVVTPNPVQLNGSATVTSGAADSLSGLASQNCDALNTSTTGSKSVTCYATDNAGNSTNKSVNYTVQSGFNFTGFFSPVDNLPVINNSNAGQAIPLKFSLGGYQGMNIFAPGYPASSQIACDANAPSDDIEETANPGGNTLTYDATTGRYSYTWKTEKTWKGTCRILVVRLSDGTDHFAKFKFK